MLHEGLRVVRPEDVLPQIKCEELEAVVVLCLAKPGKANYVHMSTLTVDELSLLTQQLQALLVYKLGVLEER